jgi:hypothetical protein
VPVELDRGPDQDQAEDQEHERERVQQGRPGRDEHDPHGQREHDAQGQRLLLVLGRHLERGHDDQEHEEVVD